MEHTHHPEELIPGYVLGVLSEPERQMVAHHLAECPGCRHEAEAFRASMQAEAGPPPRRVKRRLLTQVRASPECRVPAPRQQFWGWRTALATCALLLACASAFFAADTRRQLTAANQQIMALEAENQAQEERIIALLSQPETVSHSLEGTQPGVNATMFMLQGHNRTVLLISGLPAAEPGMVYQFWLASTSSQVAAGTFSVDQLGMAQLVFDAPAPVNTYGEAMVTIEPMGGSTTPSHAIVLATRIS